jgi:outer membrane protein TolC
VSSLVSSRGSKLDAYFYARWVNIRCNLTAISLLVKREQQTESLLRGEQSISQARDSSFIAYQRGAVSMIEVLHADENLLRISEAIAQAQTETARSAIATFKALGGGWQQS